MIDQYGRTIEYLRISVTDRCNLRCVYCMPEEGIEQLPHEQILTFDEIERVCRISTELGISKIKLTGGEPLVRKGLPDLLGKIKRISGIEQVTLTTNGILLKNQLDELMRQGLDAVNISIDTLDETCYHTVTRCGELNQALEGLQAALEYPNLRVKLNCVPMNQSEEEYIQMAEYAKEHPLEVRFIEMMPIGMGKACQGKSRDELLELLEKAFGNAEPYEKYLGNGPAEYVSFPGFQGRIGFISAVSHKFCDSCNRIRLTAEGYLKLCLQYESGIDLRKLLRSGATDEEVKEAMRQAIANLSVKPELLLNDAVMIPGVDIKQVPIIKGDAKSISIGAASIMAKVYRDHMMEEYDKVLPEYGFASNKGYGSTAHIEALKKYGPSPIHRKTFITHFV